MKTQQILALETGVPDTVDPVAGSYAIESLTDQIEERAWKTLERVRAMGGMIPAISKGVIQAEIQESAYLYQKDIEAKRRKIVGVNCYQERASADKKSGPATLKVSPKLEEEQKKRAFVTRFTERLRPRCLWDIGCNTGGYAKLALDRGASRVIGFENDPGALEAAFLRSAAEGLEFLPLYLDAANPSPAQGWRQSARAGLSERRNADGILALAILHHLCIGRNVPLNEAVAWLVGLAPHGVIEFVPKSDPMVRELLALREDVYDDYTDAAFDQALSAECRVVESEELTAGGGRRLIWYERRGG